MSSYYAHGAPRLQPMYKDLTHCRVKLNPKYASDVAGPGALPEAQRVAIPDMDFSVEIKIANDALLEEAKGGSADEAGSHSPSEGKEPDGSQTSGGSWTATTRSVASRGVAAARSLYSSVKKSAHGRV